MRLMLVVVIVLAVVVPSAAWAQQPATPVGAYNTEWSQLSIYTSPDLTNGTRVIDVVALPPGGSGDPAWEFRDRATGQAVCWGWTDGMAQCTDNSSGSLFWYDYPNAQGALETRYFSMELEGGGNTRLQRWEVGTRETTAPPTGPRVTITAPVPDQIVSGSTPIRISETGLSGTLRYYISIDGVQRWYWSTTSASITQWWSTGGAANGTHTIDVRVVEVSTGRELTARVTVTVRN